jgi:hypothetical protein
MIVLESKTVTAFVKQLVREQSAEKAGRYESGYVHPFCQHGGCWLLFITALLSRRVPAGKRDKQ